MADFVNFTVESLKTAEGISELNRILNLHNDNIAGDTDTVRVYKGYGTPESNITAGIGSLYMRLDGGADTALYRKETGVGATGWVAVVTPTQDFTLLESADWAGSDDETVFSGLSPNKLYMLKFSFLHGSGGSSNIQLKFNADAGNNYKYAYREITMANPPVESNVGSASLSAIVITNIGASKGMAGEIRFTTQPDDGTAVWGDFTITGESASAFFHNRGGFYYNGASNLSSFEFRTTLTTNDSDAHLYLYELATS